MRSSFEPYLGRRSFLALAGAAAAAPFLSGSSHAASYDHLLDIAPGPIETGNAAFPIIRDGVLFNRSFPGPQLQLKQGVEQSVLVRNGLDKDLTVHWHGLRVPNREDGVGGLTQTAIRPGEDFVHRLRAPDAGTYWYHPHFNSFRPMVAGLMGPLIVEEAVPYPVDHDLTWLITEFWPRPSDQKLALEQIYNWAEDVESEDVGYFSLVNGKARHRIKISDGELLRLRIISTGPILESEVRFEGLEAWIIAVDGHPLVQPTPLKGMTSLYPGQRMDLLIDGSSVENGARAFINSGWHTEIVFPIDIRFEKTKQPGAIRTRSFVPKPLPPNAIPALDLANAETLPIVMNVGDPELLRKMIALGEALGDKFVPPRDYQFWTLNGTIVPEQFQSAICGGGKPLFTLKQGKSYIIDFRNETEEHHPFHLHGQHFMPLDKVEEIGGNRIWRDVVNVPKMESRKVAFVAGEPGKWMIHCHNAGHQVQGQMHFLEIV
ncbi:MAG: multicopper oxidase family protein [Sphingorhabdus sp.]